MKKKQIKKPWPTKEVMDQVYKMKLWGGSSKDFYSGDGSHHDYLVRPYIKVVSEFLYSFKNPLVVCDLGCGDFNVGKELVGLTKQYIAVDIVEDLIDRNEKMFKEERLNFHCLDIAKDELPLGDCAILRQVLQHLANAEVQAVVNKLSAYKFVILTEHLPEGDFTPNKDLISGQGIRLKKRSGLNLLAPPFRFQVEDERELLSVTLEGGKGVIVTSLIEIS